MTLFKFSKSLPSYDSAKVFYVRVDPEISTAEELVRSFYYLLWLPGYFGFNWEALYDCLRDLSWIKLEKVVIVHEGLPNLSREDLGVYLEVLHDSVADWAHDESHELEVFFKEADQVVVEGIMRK